MAPPELSPSVRVEIARSLSPVRPLRGPWQRAMAFALMGLLLLVAIPLAYGLRWNAPLLGAGLWGGSVLQIAVAVGLLACALAESIPGRQGGHSRLLAHAALGVGVVLVVTGLTFLTSPTYVPPGAAGYFRVCISRSFAIGLVPLAVAVLLLRRGLPLRPAVAGALAGLGAGLLADSGWRLFCEVSDPAHVLAAHGSAVLGVALAGALSGRLVRRLSG